MSSNKLYLHAGAEEISFTDLAAIPSPDPTDSWHPIPHSAYVLAIRDSISMMGGSITSQALAIKPGRTGADKFFGLIEFTHPRIIDRPSGTVGFGFRGSWDKSFAQSGIMSFRTFICDNMAMAGGNAISFHRKNTPGLADAYESTIASAMIDFISHANRFVTTLNEFDFTPLPDTREFIDTTACALADNGAVLWQNVPHLRRELTNPDGPAGLFADRRNGLTKGLVLQAVTEVEKRSLNALSTVERMQSATAYLASI
tara:strand:+ start:3916 stop:4686 length:771 start_codon:yes stop_codon:yes gene_type:complete